MTEKSKDQRFVEFLQGLVERKERGALAALRRGLGRPPGEAPEMHCHVAHWAAGEKPRWREDVYYLVAALFAYHPVQWNTQNGQSNLGASFARLKKADGISPVGIERRFTALLSAHVEDLHIHLRHAMSLLKSKDVPIDWIRLLRNLRLWGHEDRWVQRDWAKAFWGEITQDTKNEDTNS